MAARSEVRLYDTSYNRVATFDDWRSLSYTKKINGWGFHQLDIDGRDNRVPLFVLDGFLEVWRWDDDNGIAPYIDYGPAFHRTQQLQLTERQLWISSNYGRTLEDLLARRIVGFRSGAAGANKSGAGETVMKAYVTENLLANASRLANHPVTGFTVQSSSSRGSHWSGAKQFQNILEVVSDISNTTSVDFDVVFTGAQGAPAFEFRCYYPQKGTDRTVNSPDPAIFSPDLGNMAGPSYTLSRTEEANSIFILGQGQDADRVILNIESAATADSPWNRIEQSKDSRNSSSTSALTSDANAALRELAAKESYSFTVLQSAGLVYGRDYFVGDLVTASFGGIVRNKKIIQLDVTISEGRETLAFTFTDINPS